MPFEAKHPVPVFPLPGVVLFPGLRLPLHVFELRYRTMVRDALAGDRLLALALLEPGWELDYHGSPAFHPLGCLARIESVSWLPDDRYDLVVHGLARAELGRPTREFPYRAVRCRTLPQEPYSEDDALVQLERRALLDAGRRLAAAAGREDEPACGPDETAGFEGVVNRLCMSLPCEAEEKLALLALDSVLERARRAREMLEERLLRSRRGAAGGERN